MKEPNDTWGRRTESADGGEPRQRPQHARPGRVEWPAEAGGPDAAGWQWRPAEAGGWPRQRGRDGSGARRRSGRTDGGSATDPVAGLLGDANLVVVSNREPYEHGYEDATDGGDDGREVTVDRPVGGLTAALDPVLQAVGGTWVAWGSGDADAEVADEDGCVEVPPENAAYTLQRVPLDEAAVDGYYYGYSNRVLWPVCHDEVGKMDAKPGYWEQYRRANRRFADAVLAQCSGHDGPEETVVWFQDYHLALAPRLVRERSGPETSLLHFWHTPWPAAGVFQACPDHRALLDGLLANDVLGFHLDRYCRNFLDTVEAALDADVDRSTGTVTYRGHRTRVRSFPLGTDAEAMADLARSREGVEGWRERAAELGIDPDVRLGVGVDRLDYTKGLVRRLAALEHLWETRPEWRGRFTYVQNASESRSEIPEYSRVQEQVEAAVERITDRFGTEDWTPVVYLTENVPRETLAGLYRRADVALVTPIRDGMNLVAKEYVAASVDGTGVLVLSERAGASDELRDAAVMVDPEDVAGVSAGVQRALEMPAAEERQRMADLRQRVADGTPRGWMAAQFRAVRDAREQRRQPAAAGAPAR